MTSIPQTRRSALFAAAALIAIAGCRGKHNRAPIENEEPEAAAPKIASVMKMNDPAASQQLLKGFYGLEGGAWRWTAQRFSALLHPPVNSSQRGATLTFAISVPDVIIQKLSSVTLTASVAGKKLKAETYSKPGSYTFSAEVPAEFLSKDAVTIDFDLDKSMPAGASDQRELGIIATGIGLEAK